jgi:hypothetical protein
MNVATSTDVIKLKKFAEVGKSQVARLRNKDGDEYNPKKADWVEKQVEAVENRIKELVH